MLEYDLKYLKKIRVWFKRNDEFLLQGNNVDKKRFSSFNTDDTINTTIIIELVIPRGGRNVYGLLGADYISSPSNAIEISVSSGNILKPKLLDHTLMGKSEHVQLCLPDDLRLSIFQAMKSLSDENELKISGKLKFYYGAFSEISSSEWMFRKLTKLIIKLLNISERKVSCDLLDRLIDE